MKLKVEDIIKIEGFKKKSAENIVESIKKATTNIPLYLLMQASNKLGRGMGAERAKDVLDKYFLSIPLAKIAVRNLLAAIFAVESASLLTFAIAETEAFKRTASGATFTVPTELTLMYRTGSAWANCAPRDEARAARPITAITLILLLAIVFIRQE